MDIKELKNIIETKSIDNSFKIFLISNESSYIIVEQYLNEISKILNLNIKYIDDIKEIPDKSFIEDLNLYVIKCDDWNVSDQHDNCIVICKKTNDNRAIKIPGLESWQIIDYIIPKVPGLSKDILETMIIPYGNNYKMFLNDIDKIKIFDSSYQKIIFNQMLNDNQFSNVSNYTVFDLSNAILKKDYNTIKLILKSIDCIDIDPLGLAKILYTNFKTVTSIQTNQNASYKELGISDKQFFVIKKYNCGYYSNKDLINILKLLTNVEYLFKYGEVSIENLIDYLVCKIMGV